MGIEAGWQQTLSRRWRARQQRLAARDERRGARPAAFLMLAGAAVLALAAVWLSQSLPGRRPAGRASAPRTVPVVVAATDIGFGERLTPDRLKRVDWPAAAVPAGVFGRVDDLLTGPPRAAIRPIPAGEAILPGALAGGAARLSAAPLLPADMRAIAVPVTEVSGVSGLVYPGDRIDLFLTRQPEEAMPYAELVAQNLRVLAVGPDMNVGKDTPEIVRAITLAATPLQAQKLSLAIASGQLSLALRHAGDEARVRLETLQVADLNDGTTTRLLKKPGAAGSAPAPVTATARAAPAAPSVIVMRGSDASAQPLLR